MFGAWCLVDELGELVLTVCALDGFVLDEADHIGFEGCPDSHRVLLLHNNIINNYGTTGRGDVLADCHTPHQCTPYDVSQNRFIECS